MSSFVVRAARRLRLRSPVALARRWRRSFLRSAARVTPERLRWALRIRGAVIALFLVVALAARAVGALPALGWALVGATAGAVMNVLAARELRRWRHVPALLVLTGVGDAVIITWVVVATGGAESPFLFLYVVQVVTAALVVGLPTATLGGALGVALLTALALVRTPFAVVGAAVPGRSVLLVSLALTLAFLLFIGGHLTRRLARSERALDRAHRRLERSWRRLSRAHAELQTAYDRLERAKARLVATEKLEALGVLVAGVAHELGNPLSVLVGNLEPVESALARATTIVTALAALAPPDDDARGRASLLVAAADDERRDVEALLGNCREAARRAIGLLGQLRTFGRATERPVSRLASVRDALVSTLALVRHRFPPEVTVHESYADVPDIPCVPTELHQVFLNLLLNAADVLGPAGTLTLSLRTTGSDVEIAVEDDGPGIPPDALPHLFEPFFTTKEAGKGTGLGLAISATIVAGHGGRITVTTPASGGACFTVHLPLDPDGEPLDRAVSA